MTDPVSEADAGPRPKLILTVGFPRSGKSTWARQSGLPILCPDAVRLALYGPARFVPSAEEWVWCHVHYGVRAHFIAGNTALVLDATNVTRAGRDRWRNKHWDTYLKVLNTPSDECVRRAIAGGREDLVPVIERMARLFEELTVEEAGRIWE